MRTEEKANLITSRGEVMSRLSAVGSRLRLDDMTEAIGVVIVRAKRGTCARPSQTTRVDVVLCGAGVR